MITNIFTSEHRGFVNLELVNKSIRELYRHLGPTRVREFAEDFWLADGNTESSADPVIRTQHVARRIANHFKVAVSAVVVTFRSDLPNAGQVELSSSRDFFIDVHSEHRDAPKTIAAILAHETAHIFLHQVGIRIQPEFENEVLTDTTAAYLGFGATILNGAIETVTRVGNGTQTHSKHFGYITLDEFGYIQAKRDYVFAHNSSSSIDRGLSLSGFQSGRDQFYSELRLRPYTPPTFGERLKSRFSQSTPSVTSITFACAGCAQSLRVPANGKKLFVHCPTCDATFICHT